jgi:hypothetical protein
LDQEKSGNPGKHPLRWTPAQPLRATSPGPAAAEALPRLQPGTDVMIFKFFRRKILRNKLNHNIGF